MLSKVSNHVEIEPVLQKITWYTYLRILREKDLHSLTFELVTWMQIFTEASVPCKQIVRNHKNEKERQYGHRTMEVEQAKDLSRHNRRNSWGTLEVLLQISRATVYYSKWGDYATKVSSYTLRSFWHFTFGKALLKRFKVNVTDCEHSAKWS